MSASTVVVYIHIVAVLYNFSDGLHCSLCVVSVYEVYIPPMEVKVVKGHIWDGLNWETDLASISQR